MSEEEFGILKNKYHKIDIKPSFTTRKLKQLQQENKKLKNNWNKLKDILNIKLARLENEPDYCNYYVEGLENSVNFNQKSISGVSIEIIKKAMINMGEELLYRIQVLEKGDNNE